MVQFAIFVQGLASQGRGLMPFDRLRLQELRVKRGLTVRQLAALIGVKHSTIYRYEKGTFTPKVPRVIELAQALGTTRDYLEGETDDDTYRLAMEELNPEERELIRRWRRMNAERKNRLLWELFREDDGS